MEDDKIKDLFGKFNPELSSDFRFMEKLRAGIDAVEIVKQQRATERRHNKIAVIVAAFSGFIAGVILTLVFPFLHSQLSTISISIPQIGIDETVIDFQIVSWLIAALATSIVAYNAYLITVWKLSMKSRAVQRSRPQ